MSISGKAKNSSMNNTNTFHLDEGKTNKYLDGVEWFSNDLPQMLTPMEIAESYRITTRTVANWIKSGELAAIKVGKVWRIYKKDFQNFLQRCNESLNLTDISMGKAAVTKMVDGEIESQDRK